MDKSLILHAISRQHLESMAANPPHGLLLSGEKGVGLHTIALAFAKQIGGVVLETSPDEKGTITIAAVRDLYVQTRSKTNVRRICLIDNAEAMGQDAQNALLKLLEEPSDNTIFIITTHNNEQLLPTITSRLQQVSIRPVTSEQSKSVIGATAISDTALRGQILFMAEGLPAEILRLANDEAYRDRMIALAKQAKILMSGNRYDQLALIAKLTANREEAQTTLHLALRMLRIQLRQNTDSKNILSRINSYIDALQHIGENGHVRTQLLRTVR